MISYIRSWFFNPFSSVKEDKITVSEPPKIIIHPRKSERLGQSPSLCQPKVGELILTPFPRLCKGDINEYREDDKIYPEKETPTSSRNP